VGLVVGSTALAGKTESLLTDAQKAALSDNGTLRKTNKELSGQASFDQMVAQEGSQALIGHLLTGESVVLVVAPGADSAVTTGVTAALQEAGASVTGVVTLNSSFLVTTGGTEDGLEQLAQSLAPKAGLTLPSDTGSQVAGQQAASYVLAASLLNGNGDMTTSQAQSVLTGFEQDGYLSVGPSGVTTPTPASLAVLVTANTPAPQTGNEVLVALAQALKSASSGTVMAGSTQAIGAGSTISDEDGAADVSTVDNADTETGQIVVVWALRELLDGKAPVDYGVGPQAAPSPAPTPSASTSSSPGTASGAHK
jgi:Copper transport outer membrane protein, MctB